MTWTAMYKYHLPEDSPNHAQKDREVPFCFEDEAIILSYIKRDDTRALSEYLRHTVVPDELVSRVIGYALNMVKPKTFEHLCRGHSNLVPPDAMKRVFHTITCHVQDDADVTDIVERAMAVAVALKTNGWLNGTDVEEAMEIYNEYNLNDHLAGVVTYITT